jgi:hypothetical protein
MVLARVVLMRVVLVRVVLVRVVLVRVVLVRVVLARVVLARVVLVRLVVQFERLLATSQSSRCSRTHWTAPSCANSSHGCGRRCTRVGNR